MRDGSVSARELAEWLGMSEGKIRELAREKRAVRLAVGEYDLKASVQTYTAHLREVAAGRGGEEAGLDLSRERARLASEQADAQALKNAALRGELVEASAVQAEWAGVIRSLRSGVLAVVSRVRQQLPHLTVHDVEVIDRELRAALTALGKESDNE